MVAAIQFWNGIRRNWMHVLIAGLSACCVYGFDVGTGLERTLHTIRDSLRIHSASGQFVLVEIDAKSLRAVRGWPWPRSVHARALQKLEKMGASTVSFDIDFSSPSTADQDEQLAAAIRSSSVPVILPTFRQMASQQSAEEIENLPLPEFRNFAQLASVNVFPDEDGMVRKYPFAVVTAGVPRPSIGAMLAGSTGRAGAEFPIDTAIDPKTIPHISFADVLNGRVARKSIAGKDVLIGASAIELGDRYAIPGLGVVSGPAIQLLAAETLRSGSSPVDRGPWLPLALVLASLFAIKNLANNRKVAVIIASGTCIFVLPLLFEKLHLGTLHVVPAIFALLTGGAWLGAANALAAFKAMDGTDQLTGLPNRKTLERHLLNAATPKVVAAIRVRGYSELSALVGPIRGAELIGRIKDRLWTVGVTTVYRIEENSLAFIAEEDGGMPASEFFGTVATILRPSIEIAGRQMQLDFAFGRAMTPKGDVGAGIDRALMAADRAGESGRVWEDHSQDLEGKQDWRLSLIGEVTSAMRNDDIWVAYQPKMDISTKRIVGAEALVRWTHPERGAIYPDAFIPQLERSGRILELTLYVLDRAAAQAREWAVAPGPINIAVNISAPLLTNHMFLDAVQARVADGSLQPELLTFEITESVRLEDPELALEGMQRLASMGFRLSIDDYGTGQSTLSYLRHLPACEIKIDKSFILSMEDSPSDQAMVRSTIELAHQLGLCVVAEGVETQSVLDILVSMSCDYAQGWHVGRPVPADQFIPLAQANLAA